MHPRLSILGPLEARLLHFDLVILGGLAWLYGGTTVLLLVWSTGGVPTWLKLAATGAWAGWGYLTYRLARSWDRGPLTRR